MPSPSRQPDENECHFLYYFVGNEAFPTLGGPTLKELFKIQKEFLTTDWEEEGNVECALGMITNKILALNSSIRSRTTKRVVDIIKSVCILQNFMWCEGIQ